MVMAYVVMAYAVMAYIVMAHMAVAYIVMAYRGMAYVVMTYLVMAYKVMAYVVMACESYSRYLADCDDTVVLQEHDARRATHVVRHRLKSVSCRGCCY